VSFTGALSAVVVLAIVVLGPASARTQRYGGKIR
jgi:hypothetical protein